MRIRSVNFSITSRCNRVCPNCSYGMQRHSDKRDICLDDLWRYSLYFREIEKVNVTGGEPSFHNDFPEICVSIRKMFPNQRVVIETNGFAFRKTPELFLNYDEVFVSEYGENTYTGCLSNADDIADFREFIQGRKTGFHIIRPVHLSGIGGGKMCSRGRESCSFFNGLVYPCCTAHGIPDAKGIPLSDGWVDEIQGVGLPCKNCMFSL